MRRLPREVRLHRFAEKAQTMTLSLTEIERTIERYEHGFVDDGRGDCVECGEGIAAHLPDAVIDQAKPLVAWVREAREELGKAAEYITGEEDMFNKQVVRIRALLSRLGA